MLSKFGMKDEKGISKVAIIIIVVILLLVLIAGILYFILVVNKDSQKTEDTSNTINQEELLDTNDEITAEEKKNLKENYLGVFSILISDKYQTNEQNLAEVAMQFVRMQENNGSSTGTSITSNLNQNTIGNTIDTTTQNETMVNNTIVITGDNPSSINVNTNSTTNTMNVANTASLDSGTINMNIGSNTTTTNSTTAKEDEVAIAINEVKGESLDNLSTVLAQMNKTNQVVPGYVTDILDITKTKGVYDIIYKVCWPTQADLKKYGTMDKINTAAVDRLESTTVKITLTKNLNYEYCEYKVKSIEEIEKTTPTCYYASYVNNKFGVIDQSGNTIIDNTYDWIDIPNNYKDIFVCKTGENVVVLNSAKEQLYEEYENISVIQSTAGGETRWYEKDLLVYQKDGKYGAIDYDGFEVFEPIYDKIEPLYYIEGKLILTENGKQAIADITGKITSNFKYTKIGVLGGQFELSSLVNSQRTLEQVQAMVQNGLYIVGQDVNGVVEIIKNITNAEANVDFSSLPQMNYPMTINEWQLRSLDGTYLLYIR